MPLEETPGKVCEAFRLFLQGMGYGESYSAMTCIKLNESITSVHRTSNVDNVYLHEGGLVVVMIV